MIAGLRGGSGKTLVSTGLAAAWKRKGYSIAPFKKGPDYIDTAWLTVAAGRTCRNLDLFLMKKEVVLHSLINSAGGLDLAVIEGNRGLYDGMDAGGSFSTAELAKLLKTPIILVVDCTKATRTISALILGCQKLDSEVPIKGVVLNRVGGSRHLSVIRDAVVQDCGIPVVGSFPRIKERIFPERHLGLVPPDEHDEVAGAIEKTAEIAEEHLDLESIRDIAVQAPSIESPADTGATRANAPPIKARIGILRDAAFQFYYPENLEALESEGGGLVEISPLVDKELPEVDAVYIGGGFPETLAEGLSGNARFRESLRRMAEKGLPVYAECGGAVYLGEKLFMDGREYAMAGVLPVTFGFDRKPRGHGYAVLETVRKNPFYRMGDSIRGHEFHYTYMRELTGSYVEFAFRMHRGYGFDGQWDGLCRWNVLACYTHIHSLGVENWAGAIVREAIRFKNSNRK